MFVPSPSSQDVHRVLSNWVSQPIKKVTKSIYNTHKIFIHWLGSIFQPEFIMVIVQVFINPSLPLYVSNVLWDFDHGCCPFQH